MSIESLSESTSPARQRWESIPAHIRQSLLAKVACRQCRDEVTITDFSDSIKGGECHGDVARLIEAELEARRPT